jgi:NADH:ubiquinone oxidoreductase subunit K
LEGANLYPGRISLVVILVVPIAFAIIGIAAMAWYYRRKRPIQVDATSEGTERQTSHIGLI